jgi:hypothetical protein
MKRIYGVSVIALAFALILGFGLQDSFAKGHGGFKDVTLTAEQTQELDQLKETMKGKHGELKNLFAENTLDVEKVNALHQEIQDARNKMGSIWITAAIAHKQANPDWQPKFGKNKDGKGHKQGKQQIDE